MAAAGAHLGPVVPPSGPGPEPAGCPSSAGAGLRRGGGRLGGSLPRLGGGVRRRRRMPGGVDVAARGEVAADSTLQLGDLGAEEVGSGG